MLRTLTVELINLMIKQKLKEREFDLSFKAGNIVYFSHEKTRTNHLSSIVCASKTWCSLFLCVTELHCCPITLINTSPSHSVALGDMFFYYHKHGHCSWFRHYHATGNIHLCSTNECINPPLKIVPNKCNFYSWLSKVC